MTLAERARKVGDGDYSRAAAVYWHASEVSAEVLSSNPPPDSTLNDADDAMRILERRFTGIKNVAHIGPKPWAKQAKAAARQKPPRAPKPPAPTRPRPSSRARGRRRAFAGGYVLGRRSALEATRLPGAVRSTSANLLYALGAIVFLAIVYDVVSAGKAPALFAQSVTGFLDRLVGLKDPLAPLAGNTEQGAHLGDTVNAGVAATVSGAVGATAPNLSSVPKLVPPSALRRRPGTVTPSALANRHRIQTHAP